jgi:hypothetical protein
VPLSAKVVKERISILAENVREQVISSIEESKHFAVQLDETTDVSSNSQLMMYEYIRNKDSDTIEEEMFCSPLELRARGIDVFNKVNEYFNTQSFNLKWEDCIAVSVDGAPAMLAREKNPKIEVVHCMIDRQTIVVKHLEPALEAL